MRCMIIVKGRVVGEAGVLPSASLQARMLVVHDEPARAGVPLDGAGLQPSVRGWRVGIAADGQRHVVDSPLALRRRSCG